MPNPIDELERRMQSLCVGSTPATHCCARAIHRHLEAGGARLRATLSLDAALRLGVSTEDALQLAACCELLHNASLIQDDLIDRTPTRRGCASVWTEYGDAVAICSGDLMLSSAYAALASISMVPRIPALLALVHARAREVMLGQAAESTRSSALADDPDPLEAYEQLAIGKSSSLLSLSLELPLLMAGHEGVLPIAQVTARYFAVAYQIADDLDDQLEDARAGALNLVSLLEEEGGMTHTEAEQAARERALAALAAAQSTAGMLPSGCAAVLAAFSQNLAVRLHALASGPRAASRG